MHRITASVSIAALALGAALLGGSAAHADASASLSDPIGDVEHDGIAKSKYSDVVKFTGEYDKNHVTLTWKFDTLRKGTVKHFLLDVYAPQWNTWVTVMKLPGLDAGVYPVMEPLPNGRSSAPGFATPRPAVPAPEGAICGVEITQKSGKNGTYAVEFDRSCLTPEGESGKAKVVVAGPADLGNAGGAQVGWDDLTDPVFVGPAYF